MFRFWFSVLCLIGLLARAHAQDLSAGYLFTPTDTVTSTKLNNLVGQATIGPSFITSKAAIATPLEADSFVLYSTALSSLRKCSLGAVIPTLFTDRSAASNLVFSVFQGDVDPSNLLYSASGLTVSNLLARSGGWTNVTAPTNLPAQVQTDTNALAVFDVASNNWRRVNFPMRFTFTATNASVLSTNIAHGLPGTPQEVLWVMLCNTADAGHAVGDEVSAASFVASYLGGGDSVTYPQFDTGANTTNVFLRCEAHGANFQNVILSAPAGDQAVNLAHWQVKCYAVYWP